MKEQNFTYNPEKVFKQAGNPSSSPLKDIGGQAKCSKYPNNFYNCSGIVEHRSNPLNYSYVDQSTQASSKHHQIDSHYGLSRTYSLIMETDPSFTEIQKADLMEGENENVQTVKPLKFTNTDSRVKDFEKTKSSRQIKESRLLDQEKVQNFHNDNKSQNSSQSPKLSPNVSKKGSPLQWSIKKKKSKKSEDFSSVKKSFLGQKGLEVVPVLKDKLSKTSIGNSTENRNRCFSNNNIFSKTTNNQVIPSPTSQSHPSPNSETSKMMKRDYSYTNLTFRGNKNNIGSPYSGSDYGKPHRTKYFQISTATQVSPIERKIKFKQPKKQDFINIKPLGKGRFGDVYLVRHKELGFICAMKTMSKKTIVAEDFINQFIRQVTIQFYLKHCNIAALYGVFDDKENVYLLMEPCLDGQLFKYMKNNRQIPEQQAVNLIRQICEGVEYLHSQSIIHRDLKPQNIIMHQTLIKICDFGWAVYNKDSMRETFCGTPLFLSPQMLRGQTYSQKIDNWAIGMISYEMMVGRPPFKIKTQKQLQKIIIEQIQFPEYLKISKYAKDFISKMLIKDQQSRLQIQGALNHPFLTENQRF